MDSCARFPSVVSIRGAFTSLKNVAEEVKRERSDQRTAKSGLLISKFFEQIMRFRLHSR
jgi:hypothetical protein